MCSGNSTWLSASVGLKKQLDWMAATYLFLAWEILNQVGLWRPAQGRGKLFPPIANGWGAVALGRKLAVDKTCSHLGTR